MSFTNLIYDKCASQQYYNQSTNQGKYQLYAGKFIHNKECRVNFGIVGGNDVSLYKGNLVDLESDMRGLTRNNSLCSSNKFHSKEPDRTFYDNNPNLKHHHTCEMFCYHPRLFASMPLAKRC